MRFPSISALFGSDGVALLCEELEREEFPAGKGFEVILMLSIDDGYKRAIAFIVPRCFDVVGFRSL